MGRLWHRANPVLLSCSVVAWLALPAWPAAIQQTSSAPGRDLKLWSRQPAAQWNQALPLGNGRLGAMVFGNVAGERIQLNENTLWMGGPRDATTLTR